MGDSRDERLAAQDRGQLAEARAAVVLESEGWTILARNWRGGGGEIDLVAERAGCLRFVEVKLRDPEDPLREEAIPDSKRRRLRGAALAWEMEHGQPAIEVCFLVAWVEAHDDAWRVEWLDDPFDDA